MDSASKLTVEREGAAAATPGAAAVRVMASASESAVAPREREDFMMGGLHGSSKWLHDQRSVTRARA